MFNLKLGANFLECFLEIEFSKFLDTTCKCDNLPKVISVRCRFVIPACTSKVYVLEYNSELGNEILLNFGTIDKTVSQTKCVGYCSPLVI